MGRPRRRRNPRARRHRRLQFGDPNPSAPASHADAPPNSYARVYANAYAIAQPYAYRSVRANS